MTDDEIARVIFEEICAPLANPIDAFEQAKWWDREDLFAMPMAVLRQRCAVAARRISGSVAAMLVALILVGCATSPTRPWWYHWACGPDLPPFARADQWPEAGCQRGRIGP